MTPITEEWIAQTLPTLSKDGKPRFPFYMRARNDEPQPA